MNASTSARKAASSRPKAAQKSAAKKTPARKKAVSASAEPEPRSDIWNLRLYVAGQTPKSLTAFSNLKKLCEEHLPGRHEIEVVDLVKNPALAQKDQIVALPTLVRKLPEPIKRVIGDLSNASKVMVGIELSDIAEM